MATSPTEYPVYNLAVPGRGVTKCGGRLVWYSSFKKKNALMKRLVPKRRFVATSWHTLLQICGRSRRGTWFETIESGHPVACRCLEMSRPIPWFGCKPGASCLIWMHAVANLLISTHRQPPTTVVFQYCCWMDDHLRYSCQWTPSLNLTHPHNREY